MGSGERGDHLNITVLGCGEAFDEKLPNTSLLVRTPGAAMLFDCGFTVPPQVWTHVHHPDEIDLIWLSHAHADHYFGVPALLGRMWEEGRTKPLTILTQRGVWESLEQVITLGYRSMRKRFAFDLRFEEARDGFTFGGAAFSFAATRHSSPNLAVRMEAGGKTLCYSGDGGPTGESAALYARADLLVHEAFGFDPSEVHATVGEVLHVAAEAAVYRVALVHIARKLRRERSRLFSALLQSEVRCLVPAAGAVISLD